LKTTVVNNLSLKQIIGIYWDIFTPNIITSWNTQHSAIESKPSLLREELSWIDAIRTAGITEEDISTEILTEISGKTSIYDAYYSEYSSAQRAKEHIAFDKKYSQEPQLENHVLTGKSVVADSTNLVKNSTSWRRFLDVEPLQVKIQTLNNDIAKEEASSLYWSKRNDKLIEEQVDVDAQAEDRVQEIIKLEKRLALMQTNDLAEHKKRIQERLFKR